MSTAMAIVVAVLVYLLSNTALAAAFRRRAQQLRQNVRNLQRQLDAERAEHEQTRGRLEECKSLLRQSSEIAKSQSKCYLALVDSWRVKHNELSGKSVPERMAGNFCAAELEALAKKIGAR